MTKTSNFMAVSLAVFCAYFATRANAVSTAPAAFSQYGQIQAVKNYSSNPFWNSNSPYNLKSIPKPIYATGADLTTDDCATIVDTLMSSFCATHNNCSGMRLADARPDIMVALSRLPGHNYATSCSGYIDSAFDKYSNLGQTTLATNTSTNTNAGNFKNPYTQKLTNYQVDVLERTRELANLQSQTGTSAALSATAFPKTVDDLSFTERVANASAGYAPYKDKSAYVVPNFEDETDESFLERLKDRNPAEYCRRFPNASDCKCYQTPDADECQGTVTPVNPNPPQPPTSKCPDPDHMDTKCENCIVQNSVFDTKTQKCKCTNNGDIDNNCETFMPSNIPVCLSKINHVITINQGETAIDIEQDQSRIQKVADAVYELCIIPGLFGLNLTEFNDWLYKNDNIPITSGNQTVLLNAEKVFDYINLPTSLLFIKHQGYKPGNTVEEFNGDYIVTDKCSDKSIGGHSDHNTTIHLAASATDLPHNCEKGLTYFIDYPIGKARRVFPGLLLESCASFMGQEHLIRILNYKIALSLAHNLVENINDAQHNKQCGAQGLYMYLVQQPITEYTRVRRGKEAKTVEIIAGPYAIP